ncbi:hypothetical protein Y032_0004g1708 [Ancylostoma ceylanicum]|uniref:Uncharacterized protein n=1 Tax=Ancylostoma ceylanicum TaxID=53326 RepID=A0A016VSW4_9BILA|nr:hypothetical protein Y032_0004g1708 [Ancylostoma ceylanicum]
MRSPNKKIPSFFFDSESFDEFATKQKYDPVPCTNPSFYIKPSKNWRSDINTSEFSSINILAYRKVFTPPTSAEGERLLSAASLIV